NVNRHLHTEKHKKNVALQKAVEEKCLELFGESPEAGNNEEGEQTEEQTAAEGYGGYINEHIPQYPGYAENYTYPQYDYHTEELDQKTRQDSIIHYQAEEQARQRGQYNGGLIKLLNIILFKVKGLVQMFKDMIFRVMY
ncbi:hypothetical protein Mgra_00009847, partial [Meloidogyne graminicola]